jgi:hypothetical protein
MVSIHGPLGYGPSTLPLRHSAILFWISNKYFENFQVLLAFLLLFWQQFGYTIEINARLINHIEVQFCEKLAQKMTV